MRWWCLLRLHGFPISLPITLLFIIHSQTFGQTTASIEGQIVDQHRAAVPGVRITARSSAIGVERVATSDLSGRYQFSALPVGDYTLRVSVAGFKQVIATLTVEVGRRITQDFQLEIGDISEQVTVSSANDQIERSTISVGHVIDQDTIQDSPLNGRYFLDLNLLTSHQHQSGMRSLSAGEDEIWSRVAQELYTPKSFANRKDSRCPPK